jgi:hypothetical protein
MNYMQDFNIRYKIGPVTAMYNQRGKDHLAIDRCNVICPVYALINVNKITGNRTAASTIWVARINRYTVLIVPW